MLVLLSPAKSLDFSPPPPHVSGRIVATQPRFDARALDLARQAGALGAAGLARIMDLSDALADLNWQRLRAFDTCGPDGRQPAILAFAGDVYRGLDARTLDADALEWAQSRLRILSGLYGVLRPLDAIAPHRLEMAAGLRTEAGRGLYRYWGDTLARALAEDLDATGGGPVVNLASEDYFKAVRADKLAAPVIACRFLEREPDGTARIISFHAKRARGLMARFIIERRIADPEGLKGFDAAGYAHAPELSDPATLVFARPRPQGPPPRAA